MSDTFSIEAPMSDRQSSEPTDAALVRGEYEPEWLEEVETALGTHRDDLERRHWVQALAVLGLLSTGSRELYRREILDAFPDLRYRRGTGAVAWVRSWEPSRNSIEDGRAAIGGFAALLAAASVGGRRRASEQPLLSLVTAGVGVGQAIGSLQRLIDELEAGEVDVLSALETVVGAAAVPLTVPEALRAAQHLLDS